MWDSRFHLPDSLWWSAGFPGPCCEDDTSGRHVHTHGEGFRGQQDLPASPVQNVSQTGQKGKEKPWKNTTAEGVMRIHLETNWNWSSTGAQLAELTQALGRTWSQLPGEAEKGQCGWSDALQKKASTGVPGYPREDATCQGRPTVLSRYHHTSFNNPAILYHEALRVYRITCPGTAILVVWCVFNQQPSLDNCTLRTMLCRQQAPPSPLEASWAQSNMQHGMVNKSTNQSLLDPIPLVHPRETMAKKLGNQRWRAHLWDGMETAKGPAMVDTNTSTSQLFHLLRWLPWPRDLRIGEREHLEENLILNGKNQKFIEVQQFQL